MRLDRMSAPLPVTRLLRVVAAPAIWFVHLSLLYGAESFACRSPGTAEGLMKWIAAIVTLWALITLGLLFAYETYKRAGLTNPSHDPKFLSTMTLILVLLSGLGIIWSTMPVLLLPACGGSPG